LPPMISTNLYGLINMENFLKEELLGKETIHFIWSINPQAWEPHLESENSF
jgi:hypothetical protein